MRTIVLVAMPFLAGAGLLMAADDSKEEAIKKERKKYEGTWRVVSLEANGNAASEEDAQKITVVNEVDGKWTIKVDDKVVARGTSKIDPTVKPKTIDFTPTEGEGKDKTYLGIYEIDGDSRKLCFAAADKERPTEFSAKTEGLTLVVFKREKK